MHLSHPVLRPQSLIVGAAALMQAHAFDHGHCAGRRGAVRNHGAPCGAPGHTRNADRGKWQADQGMALLICEGMPITSRCETSAIESVSPNAPHTQVDGFIACSPLPL